MSNLKSYTIDEVKKHNTAESLWIAIHNKVYDVTAYKEEHPGGPEILLDNAGTDGTKEFDDIGHSPDAKKIMQKYLIGTLEEKPSKSSTFDALKADLQQNFYRYAAILSV
ncbi:cytochrome b5-like [Ctenocephalides felis]|uniref:cytochrome b5-like n=1 Tax=Ctenocephalides felis TaxID=7515 RepID=UPI000E6E1F07|nr:cytochrome b5-like [Ctenocephalides felis]